MVFTEGSAAQARVGATRFAYKAFLSYSQAADGQLAAAVQAALQAFAKPWYRRRAIRVFRDTTGLGPTPDLWHSIRTALEASEYFVLFASEGSAQSRWVELELDTWVRTASADRLLIVWTDGTLAWNRAAGDFDWERTTSVHPRLRGVFRAEPLHLDLRWARSTTDLSPRRPEFLDAVARLSATVRQLPLDDLVGEDIRQHRRTRRLAGAAVAALVTLLVAVAIAASFAVQQRNAATDRLVDLMVTNGLSESDAGDLSGSALWFAEALRLERGAGDGEELQRIRLVNALDRHPMLRDLWAADAASSRRWIRFGRDSRYVISLGLRTELQHVEGRPLFVSQPGEGLRIWETSKEEAVALAVAAAGTGSLLAVDAGPDQLRVVEANPDRAARVVDARSGTALVRLDHPGPVSGAEFSLDGSLIVTEGADRVVRVWQADGGTLVRSLPHQSGLTGAAITADNGRILTFTDDNTAHVWTLADDTGGRGHVAIPHDDPVEVVDVSTDGRYAVTVAAREGRLWQLAGTGAPELVETWIGINHAEFSPTESLLVMATEFGEAVLFDAERRQQVAAVTHEGFVLHAAFAADGKRFATAGTDRIARVWNTSGEPQSPPLYHEDTVVNVAFDRDGSRLASVTSDGLVRVWQFAGGRPSFQHPSAKLVAFDSTGRRLLTMSDDEVKVWDSGGAARTLSAASQIYHAAFSPDGSRIVTASEDGRARIWDAATGAERMSLEHVRRVTHAAFRPDGAWLATASAPGVAGPEVAIWDLRTGDKLFGLPHGTRRPRYVEFTPGGARLLSLGIDGMAVWDLASKQELPRFAELKDVTSAAFSPDGRRLLVRQGRSAARVYDVERQQAAGPEIRHENFMIDYTAFGSDAANILVAGGGWGRMWDPRTGIALTPPLTHGRRSNVTKVAASSDGRLLATIADDGSARLWDARSGRPLSPPVRHGSEVRDVAFAPDASRFATAGGGGARVWSVGGAGAPGDETLAARARVLSAREIDETGAIAALDRQEVMQAWAAAQGQRAKGKGQR